MLVVMQVDDQTIIQTRPTRKELERLVKAYRSFSTRTFHAFIYMNGKIEEVQ